ncbi:MAG: L,D-transpeptidase [Chthoniobacteraceae bacterium]|nr:L,D-transpeptidase [Chthoniobacteraceae bacterium]
MQPFRRKIRISAAAQRLDLLESGASGPGERLAASYPVSTSGFGLGSEPGSNKTPLGRFAIGAKIGADAPLGAVFVSRVPTGEIASLQSPGDPRDLVLTRILWLDGLEPGNANTRERYVYLHGTNHEERIGEPCSHGCVRMRNADIAALFDLVETGTEVFINA